MKNREKSNKTKTSIKPTVIVSIISGLIVSAYIGISSSEYFSLKTQIKTPSVSVTPQDTSDDTTVNSTKLPSIEPNLDALKAGQRTGLIGRSNPMSKLFFTEEDLETVLKELNITALSDDEMMYISSTLAIKSNNNYNEDKNTVIQTILEIESSKDAGDSVTNDGASKTAYNSLSDYTN